MLLLKLKNDQGTITGPGPYQAGGTSEPMHLQLVWLGQTRFGEPLADVLPLVSLQLQHLTVFWVFYHSPIAGKLLKHNTC